MPPREIELSEGQRSEVETLAALLNQEQIADYLGIGRTTFHAIMKRDPDVAERYKRGKARAIAFVANGLLQKARSGDTVSAIFYLKTQAGWRETERLEHAVAPPDEEDRVSAREKLRVILAGIHDRLEQADGGVQALAALPLPSACEPASEAGWAVIGRAAPGGKQP